MRIQRLTHVHICMCGVGGTFFNKIMWLSTWRGYHVSGHMHARLCARVLLQCDFRIKSERQRKTEKQITLLSDVQVTFFYVLFLCTNIHVSWRMDRTSCHWTQSKAVKQPNCFPAASDETRCNPRTRMHSHKTRFWNRLLPIHFSPVTIPMRCRLCNVEEGGVQNVQCSLQNLSEGGRGVSVESGAPGCGA